jgi:hypothetical protein
MTKLALWLLALALISLCNAFEVSQANPSPGEEIILKGTAAPDTEVNLRSSFQMDLPVENGRYEYETSVEIPQKPNRFTVTASNVKDLNAGVKMVIWITKRFEASGGVATISQSDVPPGRYALKMFGEASPGATAVLVKVEADTSVKTDSKGEYSLAIDTSGVPAGDYHIEGNGDSKTIRIGSPAAAATSGGGGNENDDENSGRNSATHATDGSPTSVTAITSDVITWYAGTLGLNPGDPAQYIQAEKSLKNRVMGDYWRVIAFGQPLTEEAGNCEQEYCLVRGVDACTICREKNALMEPEPKDSAIKFKSPENETSQTKEHITLSTDSSEEKGFIEGVLEWIWGR